MESGEITNSQLSSQLPQPTTIDGTSYASPRLHHWAGLNSGWALGPLGRGRWLQVDLLTLHTITGVTVQAGRDHQYSLWMDLYRLLYTVPDDQAINGTMGVTRESWQIYRNLDGTIMVSPPPR